MTSTTESVGGGIASETREKRQRIAGSWWPRARLAGEILYHQIDRDGLFTQASALTYKTLFSLLPIFVLSLLVLSTISAGGGKNALDSALKGMLFEQLGLDRMPITDDAGKPVMQGDPPHPVTLKNWAEALIEKTQESVRTPATGLVAFGVLLNGSISLMIVVESTFNKIYGAVQGRSWPRRIMLYWCVLTLGPIGVAVSIVMGRTAYSTATAVAGAGWAMYIVSVVTGFLVSWLLILLMYRLIPETRVHWGPAAAGSFLAAIAWEIGKWGFGLYVERAARNSWYGSLALLPLFMMWIYVIWSVILLGLEVTYVQQYWGMLKRRYFFTRGGKGLVPLSDLRWVMSLGVLMYKRFKEGKATEVSQAAEMLMLPNDVTGELMLGLEQAGLVHNMREGTYTLARPGEAITAYDLLAAARAMCEVPPELGREKATGARGYGESAGVREMEELEAGWARKKTLAELAE